MQDWPDNWQPRGTPCGPISSRACTAASDDPARFAGVRVLGVDEHVWHHQDRRRRGPRELTGIVDLTRGKDHPTTRLSGPGAGQVWHRVQELAGRARRTVSLRYPDRDAGSLPGTARTPSLGQLPDATSVLDAFHIVKLAGDALDEVRRRVQQDTLGHRGRTGPLPTHSSHADHVEREASVTTQWQTAFLELTASAHQAVRNETTNELTASLSAFPCRVVKLAD